MCNFVQLVAYYRGAREKTSTAESHQKNPFQLDDRNINKNNGINALSLIISVFDASN